MGQGFNFFGLPYKDDFKYTKSDVQKQATQFEYYNITAHNINNDYRIV